MPPVLRTITIVFWLASGISLCVFIGLSVFESRAPASLPSNKSVVDMHAHIAGLGKGCTGCFVSNELRKSLRFGWYLGAFGTNLEELDRIGDGVLINRLLEYANTSRWVRQIVLLAFDGVANDIGELDREATQIFVPNTYVAEIAKRHEEFLFGASINPYRTGWYERLVQAKRDGAVLNKWIPAIMQIDPSDRALEAFYLALVELDIPLLVHVGDENAFPSVDNSLGDPMRLLAPLEAGVTVIAAHIATTGKTDGKDNFLRLIELIDRYPNLYVDISSLTQLNKRGYLSQALATEGLEHRMLYGSDWPLQSFPLVSSWWHIGYAPLAELRYASQLGNPFDRDIAIKAALGTPTAVFIRATELMLGSLDEDFFEEIQ